MKHLTNIDLSQNELQNAVIQPLATAPSGKLGQIYYNSTDKVLYQHDGTQWVMVGTTYDLQAGALSSNSIPIQLVGADGTTDSVTLTGAGATTLTKSGNTITISTPNGSDTTYTFSGAASSNGYTITITPSTGTAQTVTVGLATASNAGLMSPSNYSKLAGIASGAEVNVQSDWNQTTTTADDYIKNKPTLGAAASKGVDSSITSGSSSTNLPTSSAVASFVSSEIGGADAMRFKGTIGTGGTVTTLPSTHKQGDTYRVITAGTYAGQTCEIGDLIIALGTSGTTASDWTVAQTNIDGAITSITGTSPISVTGSGSSRAISHENSGVTAASKGDTSNQTPNFGSTFKALSGTVNATGHLTAFAEHTVKIPDTEATTSTKGLMTTSQVNKLNTAYDRVMHSVTYGTEVIISAGQTSVEWTCPSAPLIKPQFVYSAHAGSNYVEIEASRQELSGYTGYKYKYTFSIAQAIDKNVYIDIIYYCQSL